MYSTYTLNDRGKIKTEEFLKEVEKTIFKNLFKLKKERTNALRMPREDTKSLIITEKFHGKRKKEGYEKKVVKHWLNKWKRKRKENKLQTGTTENIKRNHQDIMTESRMNE